MAKKSGNDFGSGVENSMIDDLEILVLELRRTTPNQKLIKQLVLKHEIPYHKDVISQMNAILGALDKAPRQEIEAH